ncbi:MAG: murein biosynthesis integral membrane protein MurJ [Candidatus Hydrogenedentes bacterium]|nr:murein biosynthesis integral membrane protein MurJ [Candidatus Hydrogenedentota bacterium]
MTDSRRQLARFTAIFAGGTMLSRVFGLLRDIVIGVFIPTLSRDAFIVAFRFPNMLRDMLGEGAANAALIPVFSETHEKEDEAAFKRLLGAVMGAMLFVFSAVTLGALLLLPLLPSAMRLLQPWTGEDPARIAELAARVPLMQWTFPYLIFIGLTVFATAPLFTMRQFVTPSWSPALLNISLIGCTLGLYWVFDEPAWALVLGVWIGGVAQCALMLHKMRQVTGVLWPRWEPWHPGVKRVFWLLVPVILGQATGEVNKFVDTLFAYSLGEGVPSALFFANHLVQLPLSIFGVAVSVAALPELSRAGARNDMDGLRETLLDALRQTVFLTAPAVMGLVVLAQPLVRVLFQYREFSAEDTVMTATAVVYIAAGLLSFALVKVAVQGFYAVKNTRTPVIVATLSMLLNILLIFSLVGVLGFRGLALATTLSYTVNFLLLFGLLARRHPRLVNAEMAGALARIVLAAGVMAVVVQGLYWGVASLWGGEGLPRDAVVLAVTIPAGAICYAVLAKVLGIQELSHFLGLFGARK